MTYNSAKEKLTIPEYGRHVQLLVDHATTIEDPEFRQRFAERIVKLMMQMRPQNKNIEEYQSKLWRHLFRIAKNNLDVTPPEGINMSEDISGRLKPALLDYPEQQVRYRHYGHNVQLMIKKAIAMEDGPKKTGFILTIAAYMKLAYKTWNRDHYVSDVVIKADLLTLSKGELKIDEDQSLGNLVNMKSRTNNRRKSGTTSNNKRRSGGGGYGRNSNNRGGRKNDGGGGRGRSKRY